MPFFHARYFWALKKSHRLLLTSLALLLAVTHLQLGHLLAPFFPKLLCVRSRDQKNQPVRFLVSFGRAVTRRTSYNVKFLLSFCRSRGRLSRLKTVHTVKVSFWKIGIFEIKELDSIFKEQCIVP